MSELYIVSKLPVCSWESLVITKEESKAFNIDRKDVFISYLSGHIVQSGWLGHWIKKERERIKKLLPRFQFDLFDELRCH